MLQQGRDKMVTTTNRTATRTSIKPQPLNLVYQARRQGPKHYRTRTRTTIKTSIHRQGQQRTNSPTSSGMSETKRTTPICGNLSIRIAMSIGTAERDRRIIESYDGRD